MNCNSKLVIFFICIKLIVFWPVLSKATDYYGRLSVGGYLSKETHQFEAGSSDRNDFATGSARLYLKATDVYTDNVEFVADLRDKHDFFNQVNIANLSLTEKNSFQVRQLVFKKHNEATGFYGSLGRFGVAEAGATYVDGVDIGWRWSDGLKTAFFGGLNPKELDKTYLQYNNEHNIFGVYAEYKPKKTSWRKYMYLSNAFVTLDYKGSLDRQYLYNNFVYQWNYGTRFFSMIYVDFKPRTYIQNAHVKYQHKWSKRISTSLGMSLIDVIEYRGQQDILETLEASPYKQYHFKLNFKQARDIKYYSLLKYGKRDLDDLERVEYLLGIKLPTYFAKRIDARLEVGHKQRFTNKGLFVKAGFDYFREKVEGFIDIEYANETQTDGSQLTPIVVEGGGGLFLFSKKLFLSGSLSWAQTEAVNIQTGYLKMTYRFGSKGSKVLREGSSPRGRL